jgi:hypothetical protein
MVIQNLCLRRVVGASVSVDPSDYGVVIDTHLDHIPHFKVAGVYRFSHAARLATERALHK